MSSLSQGEYPLGGRQMQDYRKQNMGIPRGGHFGLGCSSRWPTIRSGFTGSRAHTPHPVCIAGQVSCVNSVNLANGSSCNASNSLTAKGGLIFPLSRLFNHLSKVYAGGVEQLPFESPLGTTWLLSRCSINSPSDTSMSLSGVVGLGLLVRARLRSSCGMRECRYPFPIQP
jgi:hypothetical protein